MTRATLIGLAAVVAVTMTCGSMPAVMRSRPAGCPDVSASEVQSRDVMVEQVMALNEKAARIEAQLAAQNER